MYQPPELTIRLRALWRTLRTKWLSLSLLFAFVWVMVPLVGGVQTATREMESVQRRLDTLQETSTIRIQSEDKTRGQLADIREELRAAIENIRFLKERMDRIEDGRTTGMMGRGADANAFIDAELTKLLSQFGAKRVYVFQKHDGRTTTEGSHLWFYSMTHEVVAPGVSREAIAYQTLPESLFLSWDRELEKRRIVEFPPADGAGPDDPDDWLRRIMKERGTKKVVAAPLFSSRGADDGTLIGFVGLDFDHEKLDINMAFMRPFLYRSAIAIMGALLK